MAILHSIGSGNFTAAATWGTVNNNGSGGSASFLDARTTASNISSILSSSNSTSFQTGANITVEGVAVQFASRVASPTGTLTVELYDVTNATSVAQVIVNVSDIPTTLNSNANNGIGWVYFKFSSTKNLTSGTNYQIRMATSSSTQISGWADATASNWSRALVTTTTAAPGASDTLLINGALTATGASSTYTVTMDNTSLATAYGLTYIGLNGVLSWSTAAGTNQIQFNNNVFVTRGGELRMGNSTTPIPSGSTAILEISCTTPIQYALNIYGGTFNSYGNAITTKAKLAADVSAAATTSTTDVSTGWLSGSTIGFASTTRTASQAEIVTLNATATGTTLSHGALVNAHGGNANTLVQADLINLSRNVIIRSTSTTNVTCIRTGSVTPIFNAYYTQFVNLGNASNAGISCWTVNSASGATDISYCSIYYPNPISSTPSVRIGSLAANIGSTLPTSFNFNNNTCYGSPGQFVVQDYTGSYNITNTPTIDYNVFMKSAGQAFELKYITGTFTNNIITSSGGIALTFNSNPGGTSNTNADNNTIYSTQGQGIWFIYTPSSTSDWTWTINNLRTWRNNGAGITMQNVTLNTPNSGLKFTNMYNFGNVSGLALDGYLMGRIIFEDCRIWGGSIVQTGYGITSGAGNQIVDTVNFDNCQFGKDHSGNTSSFSTAVMNIGLLRTHNIIFNNSHFNSNTEVGNAGILLTYNYSPQPISLNHNQTTGSYKSWMTSGTRQSDSVIFSGASPSVRLIPGSTSRKLDSAVIRVPVNSGNACTVSVNVRKSISTDAGGANYNGNQPRLILKYNKLGGITTNTVGATMTASTGVWQTLTYTSPSVTNDCVLEFYVDCDGNTGWINIDDWSTTTFNDSRGGKYWTPALINYIEADYSTGGGGSGGEKSLTFFG